MKRLLKKDEGFTLIEMSLVLFIISALLMLFIPNISGNKESASNTSTEVFETVLQSQVEMYVMDNGLDELTFEKMKEAGYLTNSQLNDAKNSFTLDGSTVKKNAAQ